MRDTQAVIAEMLTAIQIPRDGCRDRTLAQFEASGLTRLGVERANEIISEASRHLPPDVIARHPTVPWQKIKSIGNILRHEYYRVAADVIWRVVRSELDPFEAALLAETTPTSDA